MDKLLEKLTSYNLFNYFLPGIIFSVLLEKMTNYSIIHKDIIIEAFLAYFIGLIISRISSIIVEPLLKTLKFVKFADYKDFVLASQSDNEIELLSESNNMYRVFISLFFILITIVLYEKFLESIFVGYTSYIIIIGLLILFLFSYRKQTSYITKRIEIFKNKQSEKNTNE
ncbi:MAG: hypothetical protein FE834_04280 [Gammaproteobacteria bacterium]|nr:hypothetical protein [Gammaproteobacteria bacterium]